MARQRKLLLSEGCGTRRASFGSVQRNESMCAPKWVENLAVRTSAYHAPSTKVVTAVIVLSYCFWFGFGHLPSHSLHAFFQSCIPSLRALYHKFLVRCCGVIESHCCSAKKKHSKPKNKNAKSKPRDQYSFRTIFSDGLQVFFYDFVPL